MREILKHPLMVGLGVLWALGVVIGGIATLFPANFITVPTVLVLVILGIIVLLNTIMHFVGDDL